MRSALISALVLLTACGGDPGERRAPRNLLLITIDTLRADHLGAYGYGRPTSPQLDRLARSAMLFERAYATSSWTLPSVASILTSLYPSTHDCLDEHAPLAPSAETLAERLKAEGFLTGAVTCNFYMSPRYGFQQGFTSYDDELVHEDKAQTHQAISSPEISVKALAWLEDRARDGAAPRWFLWLHYFDPHTFYKRHAGFLELPEVPGPLDRYDSEIAFSDHHIGRVLERLEELQLTDDTVLVVAADHGEEFHDHGGTMHRLTLYEEVIRVPLIIRAPGLRPGRSPLPVSVVDIVPTVCELLDVAPPVESQGTSLVPILAGEEMTRTPVLAELGRRGPRALSAVIDGPWKIIHGLGDGSTRLFDLAADPGEQHDVSGERGELTARLAARREQLVQELHALGERHRQRSPVDLSGRDIETLKNLGYAGGDD